MSTKSRSTGDVFRDLGFSDFDSEDLRLRSDLMIQLKNEISALRKSQTEVARILGVQQPRVSNLLKGRIDLFSIDSLVALLDRLGKRVDVSVREKDVATPERTIEIPENANVSFRYSAGGIAQDAWDSLSAGIDAALRKSEEELRPKAAPSNRYTLAA